MVYVLVVVEFYTLFTNFIEGGKDTKPITIHIYNIGYDFKKSSFRYFFLEINNSNTNCLVYV